MSSAFWGFILTPRSNLALAWIWLSMGFLSGLALGLFFHREDWLGGYSSWRRRLYRLAHVSFFGLGFVNLGFYFTALDLSRNDPMLPLASASFLIGAVLMPLCCFLVAHFPRARMMFAFPVLGLVLGGGLTTFMLLHQDPISSPASYETHRPDCYERCARAQR